MKSVSSFLKKEQLLSPSALITGSILLLLPFFIILFLFIFDQKEMQSLNERTTLLKRKMQRKESQMQREEKILHQINHSQFRYIEESLESMVFLAVERQKWQLFSEKIEPSRPMKERVSFLEHGNNSLKFVEGEVFKNEAFQETEEKQQSSVEMSEEDLKTLLCFIEGTRIHPYVPKEGAPQIILKSFELEKKNILGIKEKTYNVQMQLIKREKLSK